MTSSVPESDIVIQQQQQERSNFWNAVYASFHSRNRPVRAIVVACIYLNNASMLKDFKFFNAPLYVYTTMLNNCVNDLKYDLPRAEHVSALQLFRFLRTNIVELAPKTAPIWDGSRTDYPAAINTLDKFQDIVLNRVVTMSTAYMAEVEKFDKMYVHAMERFQAKCKLYEARSVVEVAATSALGLGGGGAGTSGAHALNRPFRLVSPRDSVVALSSSTSSTSSQETMTRRDFTHALIATHYRFNYIRQCSDGNPGFVVEWRCPYQAKYVCRIRNVCVFFF